MLLDHLDLRTFLPGSWSLRPRVDHMVTNHDDLRGGRAGAPGQRRHVPALHLHRSGGHGPRGSVGGGTASAGANVDEDGRGPRSCANARPREGRGGGHASLRSPPAVRGDRGLRAGRDQGCPGGSSQPRRHQGGAGGLARQPRGDGGQGTATGQARRGGGVEARGAIAVGGERVVVDATPAPRRGAGGRGGRQQRLPLLDQTFCPGGEQFVTGLPPQLVDVFAQPRGLKWRS